MMDLTLGGPVVTDETSSSHLGNCTDSVFGCVECWDADNDNLGHVFECGYCHAVTNTCITRAIDEPVMYPLCKGCRDKVDKENDEAYEEVKRLEHWLFGC